MVPCEDGELESSEFGKAGTVMNVERPEAAQGGELVRQPAPGIGCDVEYRSGCGNGPPDDELRIDHVEAASEYESYPVPARIENRVATDRFSM